MDAEPMDAGQLDAEQFEELRGLLTAVAYRMLGSLAEAEDAVQDAWLRVAQAAGAPVREPRAYLLRVVTRLCLDRLTSARARHEQYVGAWLPEPLPATHPALGPLDRVEQRDAVSFAVLVLLERLTPRERAVFVLREAFELPFTEIAEVLGEPEATCRQLAVRGRRHIAESRPRFLADRDRAGVLLDRFLDAAAGGDLAGLSALLAEDATMVSDGGGVVRAALRAIVGRDKVARLVAALGTGPAAGLRRVAIEVNGGPAVVLLDDAGRPFGLVAAEVSGGEEDRLTTLWVLLNPAKLRALDPTG